MVGFHGLITHPQWPDETHEIWTMRRQDSNPGLSRTSWKARSDKKSHVSRADPMLVEIHRSRGQFEPQYKMPGWRIGCSKECPVRAGFLPLVESSIRIRTDFRRSGSPTSKGESRDPERMKGRRAPDRALTPFLPEVKGASVRTSTATHQLCSCRPLAPSTRPVPLGKDWEQ